MFVPGSRDPKNLDSAMRNALADSLQYILSETGSEAAFDAQRTAMESALREIRSHRVKPGVFGRYYKLVLALERGDLRNASVLFSEIIALSNVSPTLRVLRFDEQTLGADKALYAELIDPSPHGVPLFDSPKDEQWARFSDNVSNALDIIQTADPDLAAEIRCLAVEIVAAAPLDLPDARSFGSASSFMLWGALIVNAKLFNNATGMLQTIVHEAAHQLLFAYSIEEPLVTNAFDERYVSPLRSDPRPMDGVFHATFVTARVHYAFSKIRAVASRPRTRIDVPDIDSRLDTLKDLYFGGFQTIEQHAKLTETGRRIIEESREYMKAA